MDARRISFGQTDDGAGLGLKIALLFRIEVAATAELARIDLTAGGRALAAVTDLAGATVVIALSAVLKMRLKINLTLNGALLAAAIGDGQGAAGLLCLGEAQLLVAFWLAGGLLA